MHAPTPRSRFALAAALLAAAPALAIQIGTRDTFTDLSVQEWFGANPTNFAGGGPQGAGDAYLRSTSVGGSGPASRLAIYNGEQRWIGDYQAAGVTSFEVDMANYGTTTLEMRTVLLTVTGARWTSRNAVLLPADGSWHHLAFNLDSASMVSVLGSDTYQAMITNVARIMFRHDAGTPSSGGTVIATSAGFDNILAVPGPGAAPLLALAALARRRRR